MLCDSVESWFVTYLLIVPPTVMWMLVQYPHHDLMIGCWTPPCWKHVVSRHIRTVSCSIFRTIFLQQPQQVKPSNIFSWKHNYERRSWSRTKIFLGKKTVEVEREAMSVWSKSPHSDSQQLFVAAPRKLPPVVLPWYCHSIWRTVHTTRYLLVESLQWSNMNDDHILNAVSCHCLFRKNSESTYR